MSLLLIALVGLAFANSFTAGLVFDNRVVILEDSRVHSLTFDNLQRIATTTYWWPLIPTALYRPLTTLSYLFNYALVGNGAHPFGYHAVNFVLHVGNVLLVFAVARRLTSTRWLAWSITALWAVHPVLTEAVTNVVGRADLLAGFGVLASLWCHIRAGETSSRTARRWWRLGVGVAAAVGLFSKESAIAVVAVIPLWDLLVAPRAGSQRDIWTGWLPVVPPVLLFVGARALVLHAQPSPVYPFVDNPLVAAPWWQARLTAIAVAAHYLRVIVWPATLSCDYSFPQITAATGAPGDWLRWLVVAAAIAAGVFASRRSRALGFVILSAVCLFLPGSNLLFTSGTIMAERLVYLPAIGLIAAAAAAGRLVMRRMAVPTPAAVAAVTVLLAALIGRTVVQNRVWRDEVTLWTAAVDASPRSFKAHGALAEALYNADASRANLPQVIAHKEQSLALLRELPDPLLVSDVYGQAATYYLERGDWLRQHEPASGEEARAAYHQAAKWAAVFVEAIDASRPGAQPPSAKQRSEAQLLLSTATLKSEDAAAAVSAAHRGRLTDPFRAAAYQAEAAALVDARRADDAAIVLLTGFIVTGETALRTATIDLYRAGVDTAGCAVGMGAAGPVLNQQCETVQRHICAASAEAVAVLTTAGRLQLAEQAKTAAIQQFGCGAAASGTR